MNINRKIRKIARYLGHLKPSELFVLGVAIDAPMEEHLNQLGFDFPPIPGQQLLPKADGGPACRRNAEGFPIIHRDQPMETAYRQVEWHWTQFRGHDETEEKSKLVDVPYRRYPRTQAAPYSVELRIEMRDDGKIFIIAGPFENIPEKLVIATNTANMLYEIFGGCEILGKDLISWVSAPIRRLNWQMLPPGKNPWESAHQALEQMVERQPTGKQSVLRARLAAVGEKKPDFVAVGLGGFDGYTAFGFVARGLCILECPHINNATYVLPLDSWEPLSLMSKAEILDTKVHQARIIHNSSWFNALDNLFPPEQKRA